MISKTRTTNRCQAEDTLTDLATAAREIRELLHPIEYEGTAKVDESILYQISGIVRLVMVLETNISDFSKAILPTLPKEGGEV